MSQNVPSAVPASPSSSSPPIYEPIAASSQQQSSTIGLNLNLNHQRRQRLRNQNQNLRESMQLRSRTSNGRNKPKPTTNQSMILGDDDDEGGNMNDDSFVVDDDDDFGVNYNDNYNDDDDDDNFYADPLIDTSESSVDYEAYMSFLTRLKKLYPQTNVEELPQSWSTKDKAALISLSENNLKVHCKGSGAKRVEKEGDHNNKSASSVRASHQIPQSCLIYYFEIKILSKSRDGYVGVGLSGADTNLSKLPGWAEKSFGYHGDDGSAFSSTGQGRIYGPTFTVGDTIGCGLNLVENSVFYTKNGLNLGVAFTNLPQNLPLYPTVGLRSPGEEIEVNFGQQQFCYDIEQDLRALRKQLTQTIANYPIDYSEWQTTLHKLVQSWLIHNSYPETARTFSRSTKLNFTDGNGDVGNSDEKLFEIMQKRAHIQNLVLQGKISAAIRATNQLDPSILQENYNLLFALKCRQFIEILLGNEIDTGPTIDFDKFLKNSSTRNPIVVQNESNHFLNEQQNNQNGHANGHSNLLTNLNGAADTDSTPTTSTPTTPTTPTTNLDNSFNVSIVRTQNGSISTNNSLLSSSNQNDSQMDVDSNLNSSSNTTNQGLPIINDSNLNNFERDEGGDINEDLTIIRNDRDEKLLSFGRELRQISIKLKRRFGKNEHNKQMLINAFSLMAYNDPRDSPDSWLIKSSEREPLSQLLNNAIVKSQNQKQRKSLNNIAPPPRPPLENIVKHIKLLLKSNSSRGAWLVDKL